MPNPVLKPLVLTDEERSTLERWARRPKSAQALALRCRIVLAAAGGASNTTVAGRLGLDVGTVRKWRSRFLARRLEGLTDEPRPGAPRTITDAMVERVITKTLEEKPKAATIEILDAAGQLDKEHIGQVVVPRSEIQRHHVGTPVRQALRIEVRRKPQLLHLFKDHAARGRTDAPATMDGPRHRRLGDAYCLCELGDGHGSVTLRNRLRSPVMGIITRSAGAVKRFVAIRLQSLGRRPPEGSRPKALEGADHRAGKWLCSRPWSAVGRRWSGILTPGEV